ncbi:MAG TPA: acetate--CoA ligase family protein [Dehalococcoidia bacterium]|nr:acetate--CoA ligase family protein [Dehalococcoidia bacterium]
MTTLAEVVSAARSQGRRLLNEVEAKQVLAEAGVPVVPAKLARTRDEAVALAREAGFPVALKVVSLDIAHKSDVGGVKLGLADEAAVAAAFDEIMTSAKQAQPDARIDGVSVQEMAAPGTEVIIGVNTDPQFGPVLMFGLGGVLVEVLEDVAFRIVPIEPRDARHMVREIKGFKLLEGYRGSPPADVAALESLLLKVSEFVDAHPEVAELDLNPVFAYPDGAVAVDARIVLAD